MENGKMIRFSGEQQIDKRDAKELEIIVEQMRQAQKVHIDPMKYAFDRSGIRSTRFYALVRKYLPYIMMMLGKTRAVYFAADMTKSGRGMFGRLGGSSKRSQYHPPSLMLE